MFSSFRMGTVVRYDEAKLRVGVQFPHPTSAISVCVCPVWVPCGALPSGGCLLLGCPLRF